VAALDDDDPLWEQHSGGDGHRGVEWGKSDGVLAEAFYAALPEHTRFVLDLLMDHPGERLSSDWIAGQLTRRRASGTPAAGRRSVSTSMSPAAQPTARSGRRMPFYWWRTNADASSYAMKPGVAKLFRDARHNIGNHAEPGSGDWDVAEVTATVDDYLAMLEAELAGERYSKAAHRRALLPRLNPVRTAAAVEFKHQNISAAMLDLGLPYIRGYKPRSNYQAALATGIRRRLEAEPHLLRILREGASAGTPPPGPLQRMPPPSPSSRPVASPRAGQRTGRHPDYGALDEENRRRGAQGEQLVVGYERSWLRQHGRPDLAGRSAGSPARTATAWATTCCPTTWPGTSATSKSRPPGLAPKPPSTSPPPNWISRNFIPVAMPSTGFTTSCASPGSSPWKANLAMPSSSPPSPTGHS
jgi:hypothetical protein